MAHQSAVADAAELSGLQNTSVGIGGPLQRLLCAFQGFVIESAAQEKDEGEEDTDSRTPYNHRRMCQHLGDVHDGVCCGSHSDAWCVLYLKGCCGRWWLLREDEVEGGGARA